MEPEPGKAVALWAVVLGLATLLGAGYALRDRIRHEYYRRISAAPPIDAVIQAVKNEEKLAVLSVGREQGVQEGFRFTVCRGGRFVGKVKVIKVYEDLCGARVLYSRESIQVGDKASTRP